jgi:hypothetical protein
VLQFWDRWLVEAFHRAGETSTGISTTFLYLDPMDLDGFQKTDPYIEERKRIAAKEGPRAMDDVPFAYYSKAEIFGENGPLNDSQLSVPARGILISLSQFLSRLEVTAGELGIGSHEQFRAGLAEFTRKA